MPLSVKAISMAQLEESCKIVNYDPAAFLRQDKVFKLMERIYRQRAKLRGEFGQYREVKAHLFAQTAAYQKPHDWDRQTPDLPSGWSVGF